MTTESVAELVRAHIVRTRPHHTRNLDFSDDSSLTSTGILDSVGVFELVAFLEQRFGLEIADDELEWKNFETVTAVTRFVESKMATAGPR